MENTHGGCTDAAPTGGQGVGPDPGSCYTRRSWDREGGSGSMSELLRYAGTLRGGEALVGPRRVQLDLTDRCQGRCVACWNNSPLLPTRPAREPAVLPTARVNTLLGELTSCGV